MTSLLLFGGTSEGRMLAEQLSASGRFEVTVSVATGYGRAMLPAHAPRLHVREGRLDLTGISTLLGETRPAIVLDATHPFATAASETIAVACRVCEVRCLRIKREQVPIPDGCVRAADFEQAAVWAAESTGNLMLAIGSKQLGCFLNSRVDPKRVFVRVLPTVAAIEACVQFGCLPSHLIAMQGPFSEELNQALLRQFDIRVMVTKESGLAGGFPEKVCAAQACGVRLIVVGRPASTCAGMSPGQALALLLEEGENMGAN